MLRRSKRKTTTWTVELRRLEGHPEACRAVAVLAAARVVADGEHAPNGLRLVQAWPVAGLRDADAGSPPPWPTREVFAPRADAARRIREENECIEYMSCD